MATRARLSRSPEDIGRRSLERFRVAFEHSPIGIALESLDGRLVKVNDALCRITGYTQVELVSAAGDALSHPDDAAAARAQRESLLAGCVTASADHRYLRPDGRAIWTRVSRSLVRDDLGAPVEFIVQVVDISEHKRAQAQQRLDEAATERYASELAPSPSGVVGEAAGAPVPPSPRDDALVARLARDLRYATLTGDRVSVFCIRLDALPAAPGTEDVMRELELRLKRAVRPHDTVDRTGDTQYTVVCTGMSAPRTSSPCGPG